MERGLEVVLGVPVRLGVGSEPGTGQGGGSSRGLKVQVKPPVLALGCAGGSCGSRGCAGQGLAPKPEPESRVNFRFGLLPRFKLTPGSELWLGLRGNCVSIRVRAPAEVGLERG